jgi:methionyl-tRNA formyltransferase
MKILLLGPCRNHINTFIQSLGDEIITNEKPLTGQSKILQNVDFIISYGYRHIIQKDVLCLFPNKIINLHISYLPWNRGADPNLWSFLEDSPKGVTIHCVNQGLDTGDIFAQAEVDYNEEDTLRTMYERLTVTIENLFRQIWSNVRNGKIGAFPQSKGGSYHNISDRKQYEHLLTQDWDTSVNQLIGKAKKEQNVVRHKKLNSDR